MFCIKIEIEWNSELTLHDKLVQEKKWQEDERKRENIIIATVMSTLNNKNQAKDRDSGYSRRRRFKYENLQIEAKWKK